LTWVRERNAASQKVLEAEPGFAAMRESILSVLDSREQIPYISRRGDLYYNFWRDADHPRGLWRRTTLASYRAPAQHWTFYEIDPVVERIARNDEYFTYLRTCGGNCTVITGDGRVSIARAEPHKYGVIMLDAFSSDAVPMHLMTKDSMALYLSKLAPGGVIVFNISNMHLTFSGVLARMAADAGLEALWQREPPDAGSWALGKFPSEWLVVARNRSDFGRLNADSRWKTPAAPAGTPLWTDDFSNILSVIRR